MPAIIKVHKDKKDSSRSESRSRSKSRSRSRSRSKGKSASHRGEKSTPAHNRLLRNVDGLLVKKTGNTKGGDKRPSKPKFLFYVTALDNKKHPVRDELKVVSPAIAVHAFRKRHGLESGNFEVADSEGHWIKYYVDEHNHAKEVEANTAEEGRNKSTASRKKSVKKSNTKGHKSPVYKEDNAREIGEKYNVGEFYVEYAGRHVTERDTALESAGKRFYYYYVSLVSGKKWTKTKKVKANAPPIAATQYRSMLGGLQEGQRIVVHDTKTHKKGSTHFIEYEEGFRLTKNDKQVPVLRPVGGNVETKSTKSKNKSKSKGKAKSTKSRGRPRRSRSAATMESEEEEEEEY